MVALKQKQTTARPFLEWSAGQEKWFKRGSDPSRIETRILSEGKIDLTPPGFSVSVADLLGDLPPSAIKRN